MQREADWIIEALERDPAKTQTGLAKALGINKSGVSRMLKGERRLKFEEAQRAAEYLGLGPTTLERAGFSEPEHPYLAETPSEGAAIIYASNIGTEGIWRLDLSHPIERRSQAPEFLGADLTFGFYAPDDAMAPRFFTGEIIWANPGRPASTGQDALILAEGASLHETRAFLCVLEKQTSDLLTCRQYGANRIKDFTVRDWRAVHVYGRE